MEDEESLSASWPWIAAWLRGKPTWRPTHQHGEDRMQPKVQRLGAALTWRPLTDRRRDQLLLGVPVGTLELQVASNSWDPVARETGTDGAEERQQTHAAYGRGTL